MIRSALTRAVALAFLTLPGLALAAAAAPAAEAPRALSEAERQAVVLAAEYLDQGPAAWWDRLSRTSPLRRLGREAALAEIEVRAGAPAGAEWALEAAPREIRGAVFTLGFPSGVDDTLVLDLVQEDGGWKIGSLRTAAEPVAAKQPAEGTDAIDAIDGKTAAAAAPARPSALAPLARSLARIPVWLLLVVGAAGALLLAAAGLERHQRALAIPLGLAGGLVAASVLAAALLPRVLAPGPVVAGGSGDPEFAELRSLLPLRRALTQAEGAVQSAVPAETRAAGVAGQVAQLWWAQNLLGGMDLRGVDGVLKGFPSPGGFPLAELLRARVAFLRLEELATATGYQRAAATGLAHEGLLYESAEAFLLLGFHEHAKQFLHQLGALGARRSAAWYALARIAVLDDQTRDAGQYFRTAWQLEPSPRAEILDTPLLTALLADLQIRELIHLGDAEEPVVPCPQASIRAIALPAGFEARLLGGTLRIHRGETELRVPGGCDLAPVGTPSDPAGVWARQRAESLLARLPTLLKAARTPGALSQPAVRQRTEDAAEALAERRRWPDLLALTESLSGEPASLPPDLVRLRAEALRSSGRDAEARDLLILLAKGNTADRRTDPGTLYDLAHLLAGEGSFDTAMKLAAKADSQLPFESSGNLLRQLRMEKRLAASSEVFHSPHFAIRYQPERGEKFARETARILEAERQRLLAWIPLASSRVVEVHLLPYDDFKLGYSPDMDVLGLYDGKIRVPLGNAPKFVPFIVSLLTHELAHALITEKTADQAPRWFQEGLAQHLEMVDDDVNPIGGYRDKENLAGFPLIEPAIGSYSPALVAIGYDESRWTLHYVEHRYGPAGIRRLLDAFRAGKTTDEAITTALGLPVARFNQELWDWGVNQAPVVWKVPVVRYDEDEKKKP
jgi:tetratricopeptide (TPR) repeat protein